MTQSDLWSALPTIRERIEESDRLALCLDFDGTLVPISEDPEDVELESGTRRLLAGIATEPFASIAIVSGRAIDDVRSRVDVDEAIYAGNHGLEMDVNGERWVHPVVHDVRPHLASTLDELEEELDELPGAWIEDKYATASIHFRDVPSDRESDVRRVVHSRVEDDPSLRVKSGKAVFQVRPTVEWNKGDAVRRIVERMPDETFTVFVGDDETDIDGFDAVDQMAGGGATVAVGNESLPATYHLKNQREVRPWIAWVRFAGATAINADLPV